MVIDEVAKKQTGERRQQHERTANNRRGDH